MLHGLRLNPIGDRYELMTREDIEKVGVPLGSVVWELPQREIGGFLPEWADLQAQVAAARAKGAANRLGSYRDDGWGFATHALHNMDVLMPRMTEFRGHARAIAAAINADGVAQTVPEVPPTPLFHIHLPVPRAAAQWAGDTIRAEKGIQVFTRLLSQPNPRWCGFELTVGGNASDFTPRRWPP